MLKPQTRCSRKLQEYLQDLARREDLELLRAPLREHDLFPPDKDGATAAITGEELKKLVRHWKLHEARGFWKMHPQKEDLVYALLEYMEDKEEYNRKGPTRPPSSKPTKEPPKVKARRQSQVDLATFRVSVLKPYGGDLFSQRDHTQGLIYLSRQNLRGGGNGAKVQAQKSSPRNRHNSFLTGDFLGMGGGGAGGVGKETDSPEEVAAAERQRERWQAIIVEIFRYSTTPGDEEHIIGEGALQVIDKIGKTELTAASLTDLKMATYCAATLANLTTERSVHAVLMPPQQMVVAEALSLISTHHATEPTVMLLCCLILGHLSGHYGGEDALIATCLSTLASASVVDSGACRKVALVALANLLTSGERNQLVEHIVPAIKYLTSVAEHEAALLVLAATYNLSFFDVPRIALIEGGIIVLVSSLLYQGLLRGGAVGAPAPAPTAGASSGGLLQCGPGADGDSVLHTLAEVLLNLTCTVDGRERMIKDGAVKTLVDLEGMTTAKQSKEVIGLALANLTGAEVAHMLPTVLAHGAVPTLVSLVDYVSAIEPRGRLSVALCNLSAEPANREAMIAQGSHVALKKLSDSEPTTSTTQSLVLVAYINLLSVPENQCEIVEAGVLELLKRLSADTAVSAEVRRYCGMALANIADDLSLHNSQTHTDVLAMMTTLATNSGIELQRIIASAFAMFAHIMTVVPDAAAAAERQDDMLLTDDVVNTIITLCRQKDTVVLKFAGIALNNLSQGTTYHNILFRNPITDALLHLAESREDEVRRMCASTVRALTSSDELRAAETKTVKGFIRVLGALDTSRAADIINFTAAALFSISCIRQHSGLLTSDSSILWRLFGMMRGGQESTQLYAARALCNLTCEEKCVQTLLREKAIADFIAIAILRTNNEEVKGVCAECLFNLIRYERTRPKLLREPNNVLWAISRLFRVESERTQRIGALVVYNLSCAEDTASTLMETINAAETLASVALHHGHEPKFWAAAALCNLSWTTEFSAKLVSDASAHRPQRDNEKGGRGIVKVLRSLLEADLAPKVAMEVRVKCTLALYNMAQCSPEVSERLVDDGVTVLLEALLGSDNPLVLELALVVCYNISLVPGCDVAMVGYQIGSSLMKLLEALTPEERPAKFPRQHLSTFLLVLGTFFNLTVKSDNRHALETSGLSRACMRIALLEDGSPALLRIVSSILHNMSWEADNHRLLLAQADLLIPCIRTLVATGNATDRELETRLLDVANIVCNLSCSHGLNHELVNAGGVACLASVAQVTARLDPKTTNPEAIMSLHARAARNLSHVHAPHVMHKLHPAWLTDEIEPMMRLLSGEAPAGAGAMPAAASASRLDDAAACLYNLLTVGGHDLHHADNLSALLTALFKRVDKPQTRSLCAAALIARQSEHDGAHYSDGSVVALFSAMQTEVSGYDAGAAASPTKMKPDKRVIAPGVDDEDAHGHHDTLSFFFSRVTAGTCSPSTIRSRQVDREKIAVEPMWMHFEQDAHVVSEGLEAPPTQSLKLPKQPADPPRTMYTKTSGRFRKLLLFPNKVKADNEAHNHLSPEDTTWGEHESRFEITTSFDFGQLYPALPA